MDAPYAQPMSMEEWETFQPYAMWAYGRAHEQVIRFDSYVTDDQASFHVTRYADAERVFGSPPVAVIPVDRRVGREQDRGRLLTGRGRTVRTIERLAGRVGERRTAVAS